MPHSGLFVAPASGVGTSALDGRLALAGLIGRIGRTASGGAISQSGSNMQITVAQAVWQIPDPSNAAASFLSPTDSTVVTPAAGPGSGSRIDSIVVKQSNVENGDADSRVAVTLIAGTAGSTPTSPTIPSGYLEYARVTVPTGASNAAACTVTVLYPATLAPLPITAPTLAALNTITGVQGQIAYVGDTECHWSVINNRWIPWSSPWVSYTPTLTQVTSGSPGVTAIWRYDNGQCRVRFRYVVGSSPSFTGSGITISLPLTAFDQNSVGPHRTYFIQGGVGGFPGFVELISTTAFYLSAIVASGTYDQFQAWNGAAPFSMVSGDAAYTEFAYDVAA